MAIELVTLSPGKGFDSSNRKHVEKVIEAITPTHGNGWAMQSWDPATGKATFWRQSEVTEVSHDNGSDSYRVGLERGTKPADGDRVAARLESDPQHTGYVMTHFDPFLGEATLAKMTPDARRCRGAVANALRVKPWEVQVADRTDGGFDLLLPKSFMPSKHTAALEEVATGVVGQPGWYVQVRAKAGTASIIPGELPTFPAAVPYPMASLPSLTTDFTPFGIVLPAPGEVIPRPAGINWVASQMGMVAGTAGGGKSVSINAVIAGWLAAGGELGIADIPDKKTDYLWVKDHVRPGGWGCETDLAALATLSLIYEEGKRRSKINESLGAPGWRDLPPEHRYPPILVIIDEVSGLIVTERLPAGVPKDNPVVQRKIMSNLVRVSIDDVIQRMIREQRASGIHVLLATQVTNNNTGVGPSVKALLGNILLQGSKQTPTQRKQAFAAEDRVPIVPANISEDPKASVGVGCAELSGQEGFVYKGYYASVDTYQSALARIGVPKRGNPEPSEADIARFDPTREEGDDMDAPPSRMREEYGGFAGKGSTGGTPRVDGLSGAAAAAHDAAMEQAMFARQQRNAAGG